MIAGILRMLPNYTEPARRPRSCAGKPKEMAMTEVGKIVGAGDRRAVAIEYDKSQTPPTDVLKFLSSAPCSNGAALETSPWKFVKPNPV
jgi:hypothetical protein